MFGQKDDNSADGTAVSGEGVGGHPPIASAATDPAASLSDNAAWQHPGTPLSDDTGAPEPPKDVISPVGGFPVAAGDKITTGGSDDTPAADPQVDDQVTRAADDLVSNTDATDATDASDGDLVEIKQKALHELAPLVDQLDQPPEEKFRTIMMLLQASDDQTFVEHAYTAAHAIEDEKIRAQALLDIVNEINYFTQQPGAQPPTQV